MNETRCRHCEGRQQVSRSALGACLLSVAATAMLVPAATARAPGLQARDLEIEPLVEESRQGVTLWVLTIGVSRYQDARISLQYADHDAQRIAQVLESQESVLFREVYTRVLVNEEATREGILRGMGEFLGQAAPGDVVLIFVAGHGVQDRQTGTYYFVPYDANSANLVYAGLPMPMFEEAVKRLRTNVDKVVLWLDTCHAGAASASSRGIDTGEDLAAALGQASGQYMLSASKAGEASQERENYRLAGEERAHGAFTFSILQGLTQEAQDSSGVVWLGELFTHVGRQVPRLTEGRQHPYGRIEGTDMPIFVMAEGLADRLSEPLQSRPPQPAPAPVAVAQPVPPAAGPMVPDVVLVERPGGRRKLLWMLLGGAAVGGGAAVALDAGSAPPSGGGAPGPDGSGDETPAKGSVEIDVEVP